MKHLIEFKVKPFAVPKVVELVGPVADSFYYATFPGPPVAYAPGATLEPDADCVKLHNVKLSVLSPDQLAELCHQFRLSVFSEAGKAYQAPPTALERVEVIPEELKVQMNEVVKFANKFSAELADLPAINDVEILLTLARQLSRWIK